MIAWNCTNMHFKNLSYDKTKNKNGKRIEKINKHLNTFSHTKHLEHSILDIPCFFCLFFYIENVRVVVPENALPQLRIKTINEDITNPKYEIPRNLKEVCY